MSRLCRVCCLSCLLVLAAFAPTEARGKAKGGATFKAKMGRVGHRIVSPNGRHVVQVRGQLLYIDGRLRAFGAPLGRPVWRRDSGALAFVRRGQRRQLELVVVPGLRGQELIVWRVPPLVGRRPRLAWLGRYAVGLGKRVLMPRVVFRWTTQLAYR